MNYTIAIPAFKLFLISFVILSNTLYPQAKSKLLFMQTRIGSIDTETEKKIDRYFVESLQESYEVLTGRDSLKYSLNGKTASCDIKLAACQNTLLQPTFSSLRECFSENPKTPDKCYTPTALRYDSNYLIILDTQFKEKDIYLKAYLYKYENKKSDVINFYEQSIQEYQLDFFLTEIPKKLFNKKYKIQVPESLVTKKEKIVLENNVVGYIKKLDPDVYNFSTGDRQADLLIEESKDYLKKADRFFSNTEYDKAKKIYQGIIKSIENGIRPLLQVKVANYIKGMETRIKLSEINQYIKKINIVDDKYNSLKQSADIEELKTLLGDYKDLYDESEGYQPMSDTVKQTIKNGLSFRIQLISGPLFSSLEKRAESYFNQFLFLDSLSIYDEILSLIRSNWIDTQDKIKFQKKYREIKDKSRENAKVKLSKYIESRSDIAERKNMSYMTDFYVENADSREAKLLGIISENILADLNAMLLDQQYSEFINNDIIFYYNQTLFQVQRSRKQIDSSFDQKPIAYKEIQVGGIPFVFIKFLDFIKECDSNQNDCILDKFGNRVKIFSKKSYYLSKTEITQRNYLGILNPKIDFSKEIPTDLNPSFFKSCGLNCPVENISPKEAELFISELCKKNFSGECPIRLPTGNEWTAAAKGWNNATFPVSEDGDTQNLQIYGHTPENCKVSYVGSVTQNKPEAFFSNILPGQKMDFSFYYSELEKSEKDFKLPVLNNCGTVEVGKYKNNFFNLFDMLGNVSEFCTETIKGKEYKICGGSWASLKKTQTGDYSIKTNADFHSPAVGFRLLYEITGK